MNGALLELHSTLWQMVRFWHSDGVARIEREWFAALERAVPVKAQVWTVHNRGDGDIFLRSPEALLCLGPGESTVLKAGAAPEVPYILQERWEKELE